MRGSITASAAASALAINADALATHDRDFSRVRSLRVIPSRTDTGGKKVFKRKQNSRARTEVADASDSPARSLRNAVRAVLTRRCAFGAVAGLVATSSLLALPSEAAAQAWPAVVDLSSLLPANGGDGSEGFVVSADQASADAGEAVHGAADVNGDGIDDIFIGAPRADALGRSNAGEVYVLFGRADGIPAETSVSALRPANGGDGSRGFIVAGAAAIDLAGTALASGDVNGDGVDDLIVGAPGYYYSLGGVYVLFGRIEGFAAVVDLNELRPDQGGDGSDGIVLEGATALGFDDTTMFAGKSVAAGDVSGDGFDDIIVGAPTQNYLKEGEAYVVFGGAALPPAIDLGNLRPEAGGDGSAGIVLRGDALHSTVGYSVDACDVNGDEHPDLVISDPLDWSHGHSVFVVFGGALGGAATIALPALDPAQGGDGSEGFVIREPEIFDFWGDEWSASCAPDINGDGIDEVALGSPIFYDDEGHSGRAYVVLGRDEPFPAQILVMDLLPANGGDGSLGFVLDGVAQSGAETGSDVAGLDDVNGDGFGDLSIGASLGLNDLPNPSYVLFGRAASFGPVVDLTQLNPENGGDGSAGVVLMGGDGNDERQRVAAAGDVNADGLNDLIAGIEEIPVGGLTDAGRAFVLYGVAAGDGDGDGIAASADNCLVQANPDQRDTDGDGFGNACDVDLDGNCIVNFTDLAAFKSVFFGVDPDADFNGDGIVNFVDLGRVKASFFLPPGPSGVPNTCAE